MRFSAQSPIPFSCQYLPLDGFTISSAEVREGQLKGDEQNVA